MAYVERAYYQYTNPYTGVVDRVEIHEDGYSGSVTMLKAPSPHGIDFEHREITSEQKEYLSIFENQIIMGALTLKFWVTSTTIQTLVTDIADAPTKQFRIEWKRDGTTVWFGYPYGRVINYPEKDPTKDPYAVTIQFRDFEFLKGEDFPIEDTRQKIETTYREILGKVALITAGFPLRTVTSWQEENTTTSDDFLNQVYHDTYGFRDYASDGYSTDQNISYYEALYRALDPMLVLYQWEGFNVYQISGLNNPSTALVSIYNTLGQISSASTDIRQTIYTDSNVGLPSAKVITSNTSYPALRKVFYDFRHRSGGSDIEFDIDTEFSAVFPNSVDFDGNAYYLTTKEFSGNGDEKIDFRGSYKSSTESDNAIFAIWAGDNFLDVDYNWINNSNFGTSSSDSFSFGEANVNTTTGVITINPAPTVLAVNQPIKIFTNNTIPTGLEVGKTYYIVEYNESGGAAQIKLSATIGGSAIIPSDDGTGSHSLFDIRIQEETSPDFLSFSISLAFETPDIPAVSDDEIGIMLFKNTPLTSNAWYNAVNAFIKNPTQAGTSIEYRLTQDELYPDELRLPDSYFGDGPYSYSKSAYRTSLVLGDITTGWRRRGETTYIDYAELKMREVLDFQRVRQLKKQFRLSGEFDPTKVSVYESENYMYVGGSYNGRWNPLMVKIEENLDV